MVWRIEDWKSTSCNTSVRMKRRKLKFAKPFSFGVKSKSAAAFTRKIPGFTKFACPSSLLLRKLGNKLPSEVNATPEPVKRIASRFQKLKRPPAKLGKSTMESNPRARPSRGLASPEE